ncbi:MAG: DNA helicase PcrA [Tissierellia bacterium]|nr:DNA helicase PcrA [Tissierellia bacterium]
MNYIDELNKQQQEALLYTEGPLLILAGAGSGKTKTVTNKIAYLIDEKNISPGSILAFTFTNKAANEMKERVEKALRRDISSMWIGTFHSICVRILRMNIDRIGYDRGFSIYDRSDQLTLVKDCLKELDLSKDLYKDRAALSIIGEAKNQGIEPDKWITDHYTDFYQRQMGEVYALYQKKCKENNALDFDDLLIKTVELLEKHEDIRLYYQYKFEYIFVDEYQDTNMVQYQLIKLLCRPDPNLTVVGDNDQSIYKWRGADIRNILNFEKDFANAKVILLEQNYRSTQNILNAANAVIKNNPERKDKKLWTENNEGKKVVYRKFRHSSEEEKGVVNLISQCNYKGYSFDDMAILYRINAQSRGFEEYLMREGIPYRIVGGLRFYDRKEVKDIIAYLQVIENPDDNIALKRILNVPKRGIGASSVSQLEEYGNKMGMSLFSVIDTLPENEDLQIRSQKNIRKFANLINLLREKAKSLSVPELMESVLFESEYIAKLEQENTVEARTRIENLQELVTAANHFMEEFQEAELEDFLSTLSLLSDVDKTEEDKKGVSLMTVHSAKGLEFPVVFLVGMEEQIFPNARSLENDEDLEEERRLCYVAVTRAEKELYITSAENRMLYGNTIMNRRSRFIDEMIEHLDIIEAESKTSTKEFSPRLMEQRDYTADISKYQVKAKNTKEYTSKTKENIKVGDKVKHKKFGKGMIVSIKDKGNDKEIVIAFDQKGLKKLLLSFAPLEVIN